MTKHSKPTLPKTSVQLPPNVLKAFDDFAGVATDVKRNRRTLGLK